MSTALFPHHDWADADGLESPDPELVETGYFRNDPDAYSARLRGGHKVLWSKNLLGVGQLDLQAEGHGLRDRKSGAFLKSDAAVPVWERWGEVQGFLAETQELLQGRRRGSIHDLGWRLYDMGGMILFPGYQVDRAWTINQAKGCTRILIADRLDLTLECIRLYYELLRDLTDPSAALPDGYDRINPLGSVLHRYRSFFDIFGSFESYIVFWLLDDLVIKQEGGLRVTFLLPRATSGPYDFTREVALPVNKDQYCDYLVAADDFVNRRNRRMAQAADQQGCKVCPACLKGSGEAHHRGWSESSGRLR
jgi:hypothetical protein